jgi:hypothetical protein
MSARDVRKEKGWLHQAELAAGASGFVDHALERLDAGDGLYGDRWTQLGLQALVGELLEEAADLGSWGVLALEALEQEQGFEDAERDFIETTLRAAILWGAYSHQALELARCHLRAPGTRAGDRG